MATLAAQGGSSTSRFASLLQPLKDLADNWNIDIARELEQYIHLLEHATFTVGVGEGTQKLNFAEGLLCCRHTSTQAHWRASVRALFAAGVRACACEQRRW